MTSNTPAQCPLCGAATLKASGLTHTDKDIIYTHYGCDACGVEFWWPLKNPGPEWYSQHERYSARNYDPIWTANWNHKKTLAFLAAHKGQVLDVGCGIGNFLDLANRRGWDCTGIDFDPDAIAAAKTRTGLTDLEVADIISYAAAHPDKRFDLITFFDVLEHVDNHNDFITAICSLLTDKGFVAMSMPYRKHALWLMPGDVPPCHLTCWDRTALKNFLEKRGFMVVYIKRYSEGVWPIIMKLRFKFGRWISFGAVNAVRQAIGDEGAKVSTGKRPLIVRLVQQLAKTKDLLIFGLPALIIWLVMLPSPRRYPTLYAIAQKNS